MSETQASHIYGPVTITERGHLRAMAREIRQAIEANPDAPVMTTGILDAGTLERVADYLTDERLRGQSSVTGGELTAPFGQQDIALIDAFLWLNGNDRISSSWSRIRDAALKLAGYTGPAPPASVPTPSLGGEGGDDEPPRCNHWPGQPRCGVCGMGLSAPPVPAPVGGVGDEFEQLAATAIAEVGGVLAGRLKPALRTPDPRTDKDQGRLGPDARPSTGGE